MDSVQEIANSLSRAGSFYYKNLSEEGAKIARKLSQVSWLSRVFAQLKNASDLVLSGGYFQDFNKVIRFSDKNIDYYGYEKALQDRYKTTASGNTVFVKLNPLRLKNYIALSEENDKVLTELDRDANLTEILAFPYSDETITLDQDPPKYGLYIDDDTRVISIAKEEDGSLLLEGVDFRSYYGLLLFKENPIKLFPNMKFIARSFVYRRPNLLSYPFNVSSVYGPIDRVIQYYRVNQSPKAFYLAAAQACGLAVVRSDCKILTVEPLDKGCAYYTTDGRYDAPYSHSRYETGSLLKEGTVIGGSDLFDIILPTVSLSKRPRGLNSLDLSKLLPIPSLYAPDDTIEVAAVVKDNETVIFPKFSGTAYQLNKYLQFISDVSGVDIPTTGYVQQNAIDLVLGTLAKNRAIVLRINRSRMYKDMQLRLEAFVEREAPIGAIILKENMIKEDF